MPYALKINLATGNPERFGASDALEINAIDARNASADLTIGDNLAATFEVVLGVSPGVGDTRIMGDLYVEGSSTIDVDETVTGSFSVEGNTDLGADGGDTINLGATGFTNDTINLNSSLQPKLSGAVGVGDATHYLNDLWVLAVNDNGPDQVSYNLLASGTNAGAYGVGVDPGIIANSSSTDLMTMLDDLDAAIAAAGADTLQTAYDAGNTIAIDATGSVQISSAAAANNLDLSRTFVGGGTALQIRMGEPGDEAVTGIGIDLQSGTGATGDMLFINNQGSGNALDVQDGGGSVLQVTGAGALNLTPTSGQDLTLTVAGAGNVDINSADEIFLDATNGISIDAGATSNFSTSAGNLNFDAAAGELSFDDVGNSGLTLSQTSYRTLTQTGAGEVLNGTTSFVGAINRLANEIQDVGVEQFVPVSIGSITVAVGDALSYDSAGTVKLSDADGDANAKKFQGIAREALVGPGTITMWTPGALCTGSGFTAGSPLFVPDTPGLPTHTPPATVGDLLQRVAWAISTTQYVLDPAPPVIL